MVAEAAGDPERQQQPVQLLIDWDKIKGGLPSPKTPYCSSWSMAAIKSNNNNDNYNDNDNDNPPIVFPPINHENLHISPHTPPILPRTIHTHQKPHFSFSGSDSDSDSNSSSSSSSLATTFSPSDSSPVLPRSPICPSSTPPSSSSGWLDAWAGILRSKLNALLVRCCSSSPGVLSTFFRSAAFAAALIAFLYFRRRRARRRLSVGGDERRDQDRLIAIIKDRDEKINQLLDQISRMNQMLLALHKVPARPNP